MKKVRVNISLMVFILFAGFFARAQKLPNKQELSLRAPDNIKIDGKVTEWNNTFQAYNSATEVFYSIANDDDNLYLIVEATKPRIIEKILAVGITFTVNKAGTKSYKSQENVIATYPILSVQASQHILSASGVKTFNATILTSGTTNERPTITKLPDSLITVTNKILNSLSNTIKIKGMPGIPDTLSVYNEYKIKSVAAFNNNGAYTYELAIPLKYLALSINSPQKISYSVQLKSRLDDFKKGTVMVFKYTADGTQIDANQDLDSTTDFWAEYTLATK